MALQGAIMDCLRELAAPSRSASSSASCSSSGSSPPAAAAYPLPWLLLDLHQLVREAAPASAERDPQEQQLYMEVQLAAEDRWQGCRTAGHLFAAIGRSGCGGGVGELASLLCSNESMLELCAESTNHMGSYEVESFMGAVWELFGRRARTMQCLRRRSCGAGSSTGSSGGSLQGQQDIAAATALPRAIEKAVHALWACTRLTFFPQQPGLWGHHSGNIAAVLQAAVAVPTSPATTTQSKAGELLQHYAAVGVSFWTRQKQSHIFDNPDTWIHDIAGVAGRLARSWLDPVAA
jgi:hypothetical protein